MTTLGLRLLHRKGEKDRLRHSMHWCVFTVSYFMLLQWRDAHERHHVKKPRRWANRAGLWGGANTRTHYANETKTLQPRNGSRRSKEKAPTSQSPTGRKVGIFGWDAD
jgi:hypothetical protein